MIISHKHRFIFLKVQKTAGTSLELELSKLCGPADVITPLHARDEERRRAQGGPGPQNYFLPLSSYSPSEYWHCLRRWGRKRYFNHSNAAAVRKHIGADVWNSYFKFCFERNPYDKLISHYYWTTSEPRPTLGDYLTETDPDHLSDWDVYTLDDEIAVDFVGRYERLDEHLAYLSKVLHLPALRLLRTKSTEREDARHYSEVLDDSDRQSVERLFAKEFAAFGYTWEDAG